MALGDGTGWDETGPVDGDPITDGPEEILDIRKGVRIRLTKEHVLPATSSAGGEHREGSARAYQATTAPTTKPDGATALDSDDEGRIWHDSGTNVTKVYDGAGTWDAIGNSQASYQDEKASGTAGGTFTSGSWQTRTLNQEKSDTISASVSSNQVTLPAGTYFVMAQAPARGVGRHQLRIRDTTGTATLLEGSVADTLKTLTDLADTETLATAIGVFTIASASAIEVQHRCETTSTDTTGFGAACSFDTEVYAQVTFIKLA